MTLRGPIVSAALLAVAVSSSSSKAAAPPARGQLVAIAVTAQSSAAGVPLVYGVITPRTPMALVVLRVVGEPSLPASTPVRPGCWGENDDPAATSSRLVFRSGGRVLRGGYRPVFVHELPYEAVDLAHPLDVRTHDGTVVRLHVDQGAGAYFLGWAEQL